MVLPFFFLLMYQQKLYPKSFLFFIWQAYLVVLCNEFYKKTFSDIKTKKKVLCNKILYQTNLCLSQKKCMKWYSLLFFFMVGYVIPSSSNHWSCQCIFIMYSYVCIMLYFCMRQNFVCHTKQVASVPSHHRPAKGSSVVSPPLIIPRKIIVSLPLISLPTHADSPSHISSQSVNQPREEALCLCHQLVHPGPLEVALCRRRWSYREKASCHSHWSVRPRMLFHGCT